MSMNVFRLTGDLLHVVAILALLYRLKYKRNAHGALFRGTVDGHSCIVDISHLTSCIFPLSLHHPGISLRSLYLYLTVYLTRYLDLLTYYYGMYNSSMKMFYIASTVWAICLTQQRQATDSISYDPEQDSFQHVRYILLPVSLLTLVTVTSHYWSFQEFFWTFSIYLESVAMLPQLVLVWRYRRVERWAGFYIFSMGLYRLMYIFNWIYRAHTEPHYKHLWVVYGCGVVQTVLYTDFFYYAVTKRERPLVTWRRTFANATSAGEPLLQDESNRDDEEDENDLLLTEVSGNQQGDGIPVV